MKSFSVKTIKSIGYYVYGLVDPRTDKPFYIGKGIGNRVFNHEKCALNEDNKSLKYDQIRDIQKSGLEVKKIIFAHALVEDSAFAIESFLISFYNDELTNAVKGHHEKERSIKTVEEIENMYNCSETQLIDGDKFIALNCNRSCNCNDEILYENVKGLWVVNPKRANEANYVVIICNGIVKAMYKATWGEKIIDDKGKTKWAFYKDKEIKNHPYLNTDISKYITFRQNPVRYYNI